MAEVYPTKEEYQKEAEKGVEEEDISKEALFQLHAGVVQWAKDLEKGAEKRLGKKQLDAVTTNVGSAIARSIRSLPGVHKLHFGEDGLRHFNFARVSEDVLLGRIIRTEQDLVDLKEKEGVCAVVSMNEEWEIKEQGWTKALFDKHKIKWLHLPTPDYMPPSLRSIVKGVAFILEASLSHQFHAQNQPSPPNSSSSNADASPSPGGTVYVHCNAGKGRSFIVALCYLMLRHRLKSETVYKHIASLRDGVNLGTHRFAGYKEKLQRFEKGMAELFQKNGIELQRPPYGLIVT